MCSIGEGLSRLIIVATATTGVAWGVAVVLHEDKTAELKATATRIMSGDTFSEQTFNETELETIERRQFCNALEMRSAVIIRLRGYEDAVYESNVKIADERIRALKSSTSLALECAPTDAFLWFVRYWVAIVQGDSPQSQLENLILSYKLGPNEGWIATRRNLYSLAVYDLLPDDIQISVRKEFAGMVSAGLLKESLRSLKGPGWPLRDVLLPELSRSKIAMRQYFSKMLRFEGIEVKIPGVEQKDYQIWR